MVSLLIIRLRSPLGTAGQILVAVDSFMIRSTIARAETTYVALPRSIFLLSYRLDFWEFQDVWAASVA